jgi:hypothetical protein
MRADDDGALRQVAVGCRPLLSIVGPASLENVDCHERRPHHGGPRYYHDKRYCS